MLLLLDVDLIQGQAAMHIEVPTYIRIPQRVQVHELRVRRLALKLARNLELDEARNTLVQTRLMVLEEADENAEVCRVQTAAGGVVVVDLEVFHGGAGVDLDDGVLDGGLVDAGALEAFHLALDGSFVRFFDSATERDRKRSNLEWRRTATCMLESSLIARGEMLVGKMLADGVCVDGVLAVGVLAEGVLRGDVPAEESPATSMTFLGVTSLRVGAFMMLSSEAPALDSLSSTSYSSLAKDRGRERHGACHGDQSC